MDEKKSAIEIVPGRMGGMPVLRGHRVSIAQILATLAAGSGPKELADDMNWDEDLIRAALLEISQDWGKARHRPS